MREKLSYKYLHGSGIEIGGLHNALPVPNGVKVTYVDRLPPSEAHPDVRHLVKIHDVIIDDGERLEKFDDGSLDFIIANHMLEHCHDTIGTLMNWFHKLKSGGVAYIALPDKDHTFDRPRPTTTLVHMIDDFTHGPERGDVQHYAEWLYFIDGFRGADLEAKVKDCMATKANIHFHVFDFKTMRLLFEHMNLFYEILEGQQNGAEVIWVLRKK